MKKYRQSFLFVVLLTAFVSYAVHNRNAETVAVAQGPTAIAPADSDPMKNLKKQIDDFFENLSDPTKEDDKALEDFLKNSPLAANDKVRVKTLEGLKTIKENFGSYVSYEETVYKSTGKDLVVFRYLYKCKHYPIVWYFTFYCPRSKAPDAQTNTWNLIGFRYDTNLDLALSDSSF